MNRKQPSKKIPRRVLAALLFLALLLSFAACDNGQLGYRVVGSAGAQDLVMAFRADDTVGVLVPAAIRELKAEGKVAELATRWFGSDITKFKAERGAVSAALQSLGLDAPPSRDFILGIDGGAVPFSFARSGAYTGFDVELARAVCGKLGWTLSIQPISPFDVEVELASGDIDCAWGGLSVPGGSTDQMTVTAPYLTDNQVVVVKASSGIKRLSQLKGKLIAIRDNVNLINIFENSAALSDLNLNKRYLPGLGDCFEALEQGSSDAVLVSEFAAKYVMAGNALETTPPSPPEAPTPSPSPDSSAPESP